MCEINRKAGTFKVSLSQERWIGQIHLEYLSNDIYNIISIFSSSSICAEMGGCRGKIKSFFSRCSRTIFSGTDSDLLELLSSDCIYHREGDA